ncbi:MAG TPA: c-type cytochrome [Hanamia sp.]
MKKNNKSTTKKISRLLLTLFLLIVAIGLSVYLFNKNSNKSNDNKIVKTEEKQNIQLNQPNADWKAPDESTIPAGEPGNEIRYGKELIAHTSVYLGPKEKVATMSNGMNCQNCHNEAGTKPYGYNFSAVASSYPQFKKRSESWVSITQRINSCFSRSLNGQSLDTASKEMKAMIAYLKWIGNKVPKGVTPVNASVVKLPYLSRAADPIKGKVVYVTCQVCHGKDGQGQLNEQATEYIFPPLWGKHSYNDDAGLYRLANFAGFVKDNMPFGTNYKHPFLTDEQAWDVAAFVNSQSRSHKDQSKDFPELSDKPFDSPFGPYADNFSEKEHKYGPYKPILLAKNKVADKNK